MQPLIAEILKHPTDLIALTNPENLRIIICNKNLERYTGKKNADLVDVPLFNLLGRSVPREKEEQIIAAIKKSNFYIDNESDPDNHLYFNLVKCGSDVCCVVRVSSQKQAQVLEQYHQLFENNLAGVYRSDVRGVLLSCNLAFAKILGYDSPEDLIGSNATMLFEDPAVRSKYLEQLRETPSLTNFELRLLRKDGTVASCLENSYLEITQANEEIISGTIIDISEKKKIEMDLFESEQRYKVISSVTKEGVVFLANGIIIDCSEQFSRLLGYRGSVDVIGRELKEFISPGDIHRIKTSVEISTANRSEIRLRDVSGKTIFMAVSGEYIQYNGIRTLVLVAADITSQKRAELSLQQSVVSFRRLLENSPNGVVILTDEKIKYVNHSACDLLGIEDEDEVYDKDFLPFVAHDFQSEIKMDLQDIRDGQEIEYKEIQITRKNGERIDVGIQSILTAYENSPSLQITLNNVSARNELVQEQIRMRFVEEINTALKAEISEHKATQQKLEGQKRSVIEQKAKLESIFNSTENLMMWTIGHDYSITGINKNFAVWMQKEYKEKVAVGDNIMSILKSHLNPDFYQGQLQAFENGFKGRPQQFEFALLGKSGESIWLQAFLNPIYIEGKLEELSCLLYDNTERREMDKKVRDSLKEKEVLLQEVHHRVKNNLQVISSILNLQSSYVDDPKTLEVLKESQQRIKSMSFIHETIYRTADFSKLEFTDYIKTIAHNLIQSYHVAGTEVEFVADMDTVYLNLDQSIPCGLIVNELVSNALKYAFKDRTNGRLEIHLHEHSDKLTLQINDNGVGLPKDFGYEKTNSLGIQLVYALLEQIDAEMEVTNKNGATFLIKFQRK